MNKAGTAGTVEWLFPETSSAGAFSGELWIEGRPGSGWSAGGTDNTDSGAL